MSKPKKIEALEKLASESIGGNITPRLFFVSVQGVIITVTRNLTLAHDEWVTLATTNKTDFPCLEATDYGVLASVEKDDESGRIVTHDDSFRYAKEKRIELV